MKTTPYFYDVVSRKIIVGCNFTTVTIKLYSLFIEM